MKIFIACSKYFYDRIPEIKSGLEELGHEVSMPNSYDKPMREEEMKMLESEEHIKWKSEMLKKDKENIEPQDGVLVLNFEKKGMMDYIGGATFMEIVKSWEMGKKIFLYNPIPENIFKDELIGINPVVINGDLSLVKLGDDENVNIEVEVRSFISEGKYLELLEYFKMNARLVEEDYQENYYFDCDANLVVQRGNVGSMVRLKKGKIHDNCREEKEIIFSRDDFDKINDLLSGLGHTNEIKWFRERKEFEWEGVRVCLDYTKGYGYIIELEEMSDVGDRDRVLEKLRARLAGLGVEETSREEFDRKYEYYKENWRGLVEDEKDIRN
jgi:predicted adenylyl cyclase CyaB